MITVSKKEYNILNSAKNYIYKMCDDGKLNGLSQYDVYEMSDCLYTICHDKKHYATTINENVAKKFKSLKFRVEAEETENTILHWNIYIYTKEEQNKIMEELN